MDRASQGDELPTADRSCTDQMPLIVGVANMTAENPDVLQIVELLLTAEIYNQSSNLTENDLPPKILSHYLDFDIQGVDRPILVTSQDVKKIYGVENASDLLKMLPFIQVEDSGSQIRLTDFDMGARWFGGRDTLGVIQCNPVLAHYYQKFDPNVSYIEARVANRPVRPEPEGAESKIEELWEEGKDVQDLLKLVTIKMPDAMRDRLEDLVLTEAQREEIAKAGKALEYREYLKFIGLHEIGKILFVGPPGTGKTSAARGLSRWFGLPFIEVKLSMTISHYLGETSKNIDRVFVLAKKLSPCILFIDEFDFVAKTRTSEDHGAIKRAVNTLLKAIDDVSLVEDGVLLIAATNYPQLLDHAAWRRFDKVMSFSLPDLPMRRKILEKVLQRVDAEIDFDELARLTEGSTGSDLRLVIREAVLNALLEDRKKISQEDILRALEEFRRRNTDYRQNDTP